MSEFEERPFFRKKIPSSAPISSFTVPNLDGDSDEKYKIEGELYLTNSETSRINLVLNSIVSGITTITEWYGYWSSSLTGPQTEAIGNFTLIRADGTGWHDFEAILKAKAGKVRSMKSDYGIRDTILGYSDRTSRASLDDTTTKITSITVQKTGANTAFYGEMRFYRKKKPEN